MRIVVACIIVMLFCNPGLYAQADTAKKRSTASTNASVIADINLMYDNMEQAIKLEYAKLVNENKKNTDELKDKIKQMDQQVEKLKEQIRRLEEMLAKIKELMPKLMDKISNDRQKVNLFGTESRQSNQPGRLMSVRDSIKKVLPVQTAAWKDSLIRITQIHY